MYDKDAFCISWVVCMALRYMYFMSKILFFVVVTSFPVHMPDTDPSLLYL